MLGSPGVRQGSEDFRGVDLLAVDFLQRLLVGLPGLVAAEEPNEGGRQGDLDLPAVLGPYSGCDSFKPLGYGQLGYSVAVAPQPVLSYMSGQLCSWARYQPWEVNPLKVGPEALLKALVEQGLPGAPEA